MNPFCKFYKINIGEAGKRLFEGLNALYALFDILTQLLQKSSQPRF
jgi:hypothetical protein